MKPQQKTLLIGLLTRLEDLLDQESEFFWAERPFLMTGGKAILVPIDEKKKAQVELERVMVTRAILALLEKLNAPQPVKPMKQGELL